MEDITLKNVQKTCTTGLHVKWIIMIKYIFILLLPFLGIVHIMAQAVDDIHIIWIDSKAVVSDSYQTLKWGIRSKSQITNISILQNGIVLKGINAVTNDGFDMTKSQVVKLKEGENIIEILVSTINGNKKSTKTIVLKGKNDVNENTVTDIDILIRNAYNNDAKAQYFIGKFYLNGEHGLSVDLFESSLWFKKSAELQYLPSIYEYAISLFEGRGIMKSKSLAIQLLTQAGDRGHAESLFKLGLYYETGNFVDINIEKAKELYKKCPLPEAKQRLMALEK